MRDQGRLVEWLDDKGYGFIQPNDTNKGRVFLHIKDFAQRGPRPIEGCALEYVVQLDGHGRYQAKQVTYLKASQTQKKSALPKSNPHAAQKQKLQPMMFFSAGYIIAIAVLRLMDLLPIGVVPFILLMNAASYWFYAQDKEAAQQGNRRVPENTLHILSFLGGWPSAWLAQQRLRHKTQKQPFRKIYFCTILLNLLLIAWLVSPLNTFKF